ncbi:glycosyltransferase family 2 protein [Flavobacterium sp. HJJ]|uniref:glycosyltransferase family 2 protein n=1 Tax=Flavobacterium sp. HJJ TaxID=2783792 RepID=UPI001889E202|nr:glycosyltransferase family 2 protein [Flavobacterium sp. HJJ]MBF4472477.1 glycosyltransferase [Flavobacterium sp. HJJ]
MSKLAIITINYNDKEGLKKTIESVINQTWQDFEFIVIDGGSTDGGVQVIEQYKDKIDYWVSEVDKGVYNAMNKGIKAAHSEFVIFMNSGDTFYNEKVLEKIENQLTDKYDIYYGDYYRVKPNSIKKKTYPEKLSFSFFYSGTLSHQSSFIRRKLFYDVFLYNEDYKIASDWEFFIYAICHKNVPYKYLETAISNFDFTGISSIAKYKHVANDERKKTLEKYFPLFVNDYILVSELNSKRVQQFLYIRDFAGAWIVLKGILNVIMVFLPKSKN